MGSMSDLEESRTVKFSNGLIVHLHTDHNQALVVAVSGGSHAEQSHYTIASMETVYNPAENLTYTSFVLVNLYASKDAASTNTGGNT